MTDAQITSDRFISWKYFLTSYVYRANLNRRKNTGRKSLPCYYSACFQSWRTSPCSEPSLSRFSDASLGGERPTQLEKALGLKSPYSGQLLGRCLKLLLGFFWAGTAFRTVGLEGWCIFMLTRRRKRGLGVFCPPAESWVVWSQKLTAECAQERSHEVRCQILERRVKTIQLGGSAEPKNVNRGARLIYIKETKQLL